MKNRQSHCSNQVCRDEIPGKDLFVNPAGDANLPNLNTMASYQPSAFPSNSDSWISEYTCTSICMCMCTNTYTYTHTHIHIEVVYTWMSCMSCTLHCQRRASPMPALRLLFLLWTRFTWGTRRSSIVLMGQTHASRASGCRSTDKTTVLRDVDDSFHSCSDSC